VYKNHKHRGDMDKHPLELDDQARILSCHRRVLNSGGYGAMKKHFMIMHRDGIINSHSLSSTLSTLNCLQKDANELLN
jgi:hypothetical protein